MQLMYVVARLCPDPLEKLSTTPMTHCGICIPEKNHKNVARTFCAVGISLTDVQILSCQLHQNAFGGRARPGPAGGATAGRAIALPQTL